VSNYYDTLIFKRKHYYKFIINRAFALNVVSTKLIIYIYMRIAIYIIIFVSKGIDDKNLKGKLYIYIYIIDT